MEESYSDWYKTLWEKQKLLVTSNFSFSPQCFQKTCFPGASKGVIVWEWVKQKKKSMVLYSASVGNNILEKVLWSSNPLPDNKF